MITIDEYVKPKSLDDAYKLLVSDTRAAVIGGGSWQRLSSQAISLAIDLSDLELDYITETAHEIEIGAMTTYGELERSACLTSSFDGLIPRTVRHIVGTQMRNMVTVGGTVYGRFGFSELITSLMVLDCEVLLHKNGKMSLRDFLSSSVKNDILIKIVLRKAAMTASYQLLKITSGSLPILTVAAAKSSSGYRIAVGARPGVASEAKEAMSYLNQHGAGAAEVEEAANIAVGEMTFNQDQRASKEYREELCKVLIQRAVKEVQGK